MIAAKKQTKEKPTIIVTGPDKRLTFAWWATRYFARRCGLKPVYVTKAKAKWPNNVKGVIVGGGDDIEPMLYGLVNAENRNYDVDRDRLELKVIEKALYSGVPLLGICRGAQLLNVYLGGTLYQDIRPFRVHTPNVQTLRPVKTIKILEHSRLRRRIAQPRIRVNSLHNQAINKLGADLRLAALDQDDFVQAVEMKEQEFVMGVQWHPEYMFYKRSQKRLLKDFARAAARTQQTLALPSGQSSQIGTNRV